MALVWALKISEGKHWSNIIWSADSQEMVKEINAMEDPSQWDTRYLMISCRRMLSLRHWKLNWNARSSNSLADSIAKWTLRSSIPFLFSSGISVSQEPSSVLELISLIATVSQDQITLFQFSSLAAIAHSKALNSLLEENSRGQHRMYLQHSSFLISHYHR
ncbi:hypothetical protein FNV43_RR19474 [Rhamnella rubrinervis]|uniref:RNase H type-1 domain-containing protein n=1 Tax=Rhamnella rubrinervis TaxID=2594499 RepID=A0A8K0DSR2_9ROSA|nr:hypothetical protein FNV43_RR19474 [Rhamnella rubrinervis]